MADASADVPEECWQVRSRMNQKAIIVFLLHNEIRSSGKDPKVDAKITPGPHPDLSVSLLSGYVTEVVEALVAGGVQVQRSWLDPFDPRDATIVVAGSRALVFDEVTGWRHGRFLSGKQGVRTTLADVSYLGGGVLPEARELTRRLVNGIAVPRCTYRSVNDLRDGFDDALRARGTSG